MRLSELVRNAATENAGKQRTCRMCKSKLENPKAKLCSRCKKEVEGLWIGDGFIDPNGLQYFTDTVMRRPLVPYRYPIL